MPKVLVLGGYGGTGREVARLLHHLTDAEVVVAGRNGEKAAALAAELNDGASSGRASGLAVDVSDAVALARACSGRRLVVVLTATPSLSSGLLDAVLRGGADCLDCHFQDCVHEGIAKRTEEVVRAGRTVVTQAGFHPGLPAPFARAAAGRLDRCERLTVAMAMFGRVTEARALRELVDIIQDYHADVFDGGSWRPAGVSDSRSFDFGEGFGRMSCFPLSMEECRPLPAELGLQGLGVYIAGWNWFADWFVTPLAILAGKVRKGLGRGFFAWLYHVSLNATNRPEGVVFLAEAEGTRAGAPARVRIEARDRVHPYHFTAAGIVAAALQMLDGPARPSGVHRMGEFVDPARTLTDLRRMDIEVRIEVGLPGGAPIGLQNPPRATPIDP